MILKKPRKKFKKIKKSACISFKVVVRYHLSLRHGNAVITNAPLAQLVEHLTLNQVVQGSRPWRCTPSTVFVGISYGDGTFFAQSNEKCKKGR